MKAIFLNNMDNVEQPLIRLLPEDENERLLLQLFLTACRKKNHHLKLLSSRPDGSFLGAKNMTIGAAEVSGEGK